MKVIHKKISLEPYKSRINGSLKSYNGDFTETFDNYSRTSKINNYGMFPYDVIYNDLTLSYPTLMERYNFCKKYNEMLKYDNCSDGDKYENAIDYYKHEVPYKSKDERKVYEDMDALYAEYDGDAFYTWCNDILYGGNVTYSETAHINIPILITNTIDDLGEFSIFSNEWESGENYNGSLESGTTVIYNDEVWQFNGKGDDYGSIYSTKYRELYFPNIGDLKDNEDYQWYEKSGTNILYNENQWLNFTDLYFEGKVKNDYLNKVSNINSTYSNKRGQIVFDPSPEDMAYEYEITKNDLGYFLINDILFKVIESEYVEYVNGDILFVYTVENPKYNIKYCSYNELKFYSKTYDNNVNKHYFEFYDENGNTVKKDVESDNFIDYQGKPHKVNGNKLIIKNDDLTVTYNKIDGYSNIEGRRYYIKGTDIVIPNRIDKSINEVEYELTNALTTALGKNLSNTTTESASSGYTVSTYNVNVFKPYVEYSIIRLSGYTESKLNSFVTYNTATDDMGNVLPGLFYERQKNAENKDDVYAPLKEGDYLELPYQVGNVNNLSVFEEDADGNPTKWFGNILTAITFYYEDYYGNIIKDTVIEPLYGESLLEAIGYCKNNLLSYMKRAKENEIVQTHNSINETMKCKLTYHMGAIIEADSEQYRLSTDEYEQGIIYEDVVSIKEEQFMYYYNEFSSIAIKYYDFEYDTKYVTMNEYSDSTVEVNQSKYWFTIDDLIKNDGTNSRASYDGMIAAPVFREEYKLGVAMKENIESDIYIDRGVSNAFEKHLNLLNVNSFESLEQFRKRIL